jgi:Mg-chelatase subunit ChlD
MNCPITGEIMKDPVMDCLGHTYERSAIEEWYKTHDISPLTGTVIHSKVLISNYSLKTIIEESKESSKVESKESSNLSIIDYKIDNKLILQVTAGETKRMPTHIICVIDTSGSMDSNTYLGKKSFGYTRLDLIKHSLNTMVESLLPSDKLTLITFNYDAKLIFNAFVEEPSKPYLKKLILDMKAGNSTNIWAGLKMALKIAEADGHRSHVNSSITFNGVPNIVLLTDGEPTQSSEEIICAYNFYMIENTQNHPILSCVPITTIGYGYEIDIDLLTYIAEKSRGSFLYIPDISMIGTVFVHYLANTLSKSNDQIINGTPYRFLSGQTRLIKISDCNLVNINDYKYIPTKADGPIAHVNAKADLDMNNLSLQQIEQYLDFKTVLEYIVNHAEKNTNECIEYIKENIGRFTLPELVTNIYSEEAHSGQIMKALSYYDKWGKYYLRMLLFSHKKQTACNFKDQSVQNFSSNFTKKLIESISYIYSNLELIKPTYPFGESLSIKDIDSENICFAEDSTVKFIRIHDGYTSFNTCRLLDLNPGDFVETDGPGIYAEVIYIVKKNSTNVPVCVIDNNLYITPWHPVKQGTWVFPNNITKDIRVYNGILYNLVLKSIHNVVLNGSTVVATLGHDLNKGVLAHPYYGTKKIVDDLLYASGKYRGIVYLNHFKMLRDPKTGLVSGMYNIVRDMKVSNGYDGTYYGHYEE